MTGDVTTPTKIRSIRRNGFQNQISLDFQGTCISAAPDPIRGHNGKRGRIANGHLRDAVEISPGSFLPASRLSNFRRTHAIHAYSPRSTNRGW